MCFHGKEKHRNSGIKKTMLRKAITLYTTSISQSSNSSQKTNTKSPKKELYNCELLTKYEIKIENR